MKGEEMKKFVVHFMTFVKTETVDPGDPYDIMAGSWDTEVSSWNAEAAATGIVRVTAENIRNLGYDDYDVVLVKVEELV
jgi:hypothetical protein